MTPVDPTTPREPEIELLTRAARTTLTVLRAALWIAGATALAVGASRIAMPPESTAATPLGGGSEPGEIARHFVWLCAGLPLLARSDWLFGRGRWVALVVFVPLWIAPIWLPGDHRYGYVLRIFATLVACASLLVWRTLWRLTPTANAN